MTNGELTCLISSIKYILCKLEQEDMDKEFIEKELKAMKKFIEKDINENNPLRKI